MGPTLLVLSMLPSVRLRLSQRLKLMLVFCMEDMAMVVWDILDLAMLVLDMAMLPLLPMATLARGLLMPSLRLMLVCIMEDMDMVLVLDMDILVLDMPDMVVMDLDMEDMVLDMAVPSMVKLVSYASKSSKAIFLLFSALFWGMNLHNKKNKNI